MPVESITVTSTCWGNCQRLIKPRRSCWEFKGFSNVAILCLAQSTCFNHFQSGTKLSVTQWCQICCCRRLCSRMNRTFRKHQKKSQQLISNVSHAKPKQKLSLSNMSSRKTPFISGHIKQNSCTCKITFVSLCLSCLPAAVGQKWKWARSH